MKTFCFLPLFVVLVSCADNQRTTSNKKLLTSSDTFPITEHPDFKNRVKPALQYFVDSKGVKGGNNFYIEKIIVDSASHYYCPWVYYKEKNQIILFEPHIEGAPPTELYFSRRNLDLTKDIVPHDSDIHGSTYLETKAWKEWKLKACEKGSHFLIMKKQSE